MKSNAAVQEVPETVVAVLPTMMTGYGSTTS